VRYALPALLRLHYRTFALFVYRYHTVAFRIALRYRTTLPPLFTPLRYRAVYNALPFAFYRTDAACYCVVLALRVYAVALFCLPYVDYATTAPPRSTHHV